MTEDRFNALVERLSVRAKAHPALYRLEVLGLALIGYLYIFVLVLGAVITSVGVLLLGVLKPVILLKGLKIVWLPIWFTWSILRAMWVRFAAPQGRELKAEEAPALFAEIEAIRSAIKGPRPHHVLITDDYNAAVTQLPRLGPLGWSRNYLILGLPLMSALSPDQLRAVIAHEFGHLGAGDSRMTGRIYHMRITWARLQAQFDARGGIFFRKFFAWYGPYFNAYSFVLARAQEYAADAAAAKLVGAGPAAEALVLANLGSDFQSEQVWQPLWETSLHVDKPASAPYAQMLAKSRGYADWTRADSLLKKSLLRKTDWSDTHPALNDRLAAIGQTARIPTAQGQSSAEVYLGATAQRLAHELDEKWQALSAEHWRERHERAQVQRAQLAELEAAAGQGPLEREQDWQRARLVESLHTLDMAEPLYRAHRERFPHSFEAAYALGRILLERGDDAGLILIDEAMRADGEAIKPGAQLAFNYLVERDRKEESERYRRQWNDRNDLEQLAEAERANFTPKDDYEAHPIDTALAERMRSASANLNWVAAVWLVRKQVKYFPERHAPLLLVKSHWHKRIKPAQAIAELRKALELSDELTVAFQNNDLKPLFEKATKVPGCEIYRA